MLFKWVPSFILVAGAFSDQPGLPIQLDTRREIDSSIANIHLTYRRQINAPHSFKYGPCESSSPVDAHHEVARRSGPLAERLVWIIPDDALEGGCLSAWAEDNALLGRSKPIQFKNGRRLRKRQAVPMPGPGNDGEDGAWFDGVALLQDKKPSPDNVKDIKNKRIAIVGAGMSGLMTYLHLHESGFKNVELIEGSDRIGGRVYTKYLEGGPFDYQYHELGAMRIPKNITYLKTGETMPINDQKLLFQLADVLNKMNENKPEYNIDFIPFVQYSPNSIYYHNGIRKPDGTVPTMTEVAEDDSLTLPVKEDPILDEARGEIDKVLSNPEILKEMAVDMFKAYRMFMESGAGGLGGDDWSQFAYVHNHLRFSLNITDYALFESTPDPTDSFLTMMLEGMLFVQSDWSTSWVTVDGGMSRLAEAFRPLIKDNIKMGREIQKVQYLPDGDGKVKLSWKEKYTDSKFQEETYDYAIVSAPFSVVRRWRLPNFSPTLKNAINHLKYAGACKVLLQYARRFWEQGDQPIYGSAITSTDISGIGMVTYPSWNINSTKPAVMIGGYSIYDLSEPFLSIPDEEHIKMAGDAMAEIHGDVASEEYTGRSARKCWVNDRYAGGSWAEPQIGQQSLYMPTYFNTENNMIFIGEHTSYTHAWVSSALESSVRGSVQLLLELGLVDEAKDLTKKWMSRWIHL